MTETYIIQVIVVGDKRAAEETAQKIADATGATTSISKRTGRWPQSSDRES